MAKTKNQFEIKYVLILVIAIIATSVISFIAASSNRKPSKDLLIKEYRKGYIAGRKAEQAKWSDKYLQLAKRWVQDQIQSQGNIERLVKGDLSNIKIGFVEKNGDNKAKVWMQTEFKGKSFVTGYFEFKKVDNYWFLMATRQTPEGLPKEAKEASLK